MGETVLTTILQLLKPELIEIASTFFSSLPYESEESFMLYVSNFFNSFEKFDKFLEKAASISSLSPNTSYKMVLSTFPLILTNRMHNQDFFQQSLVSNLSRSQLSNPLLKFGLIFFYNNLYSHFISQLSMYVDKPRDDISDLCELFAEFCLQEFETNLEYLINLLLLPKWGIALSNLSLYCMDNSVYFRMKSYFFNPNNDRKVGYIFFENVEYFGYLEYNNDTFIFQDYRLLDTLIEPFFSLISHSPELFVNFNITYQIEEICLEKLINYNTSSDSLYKYSTILSWIIIIDPNADAIAPLECSQYILSQGLCNIQVSADLFDIIASLTISRKSEPPNHQLIDNIIIAVNQNCFLKLYQKRLYSLFFLTLTALGKGENFVLNAFSILKEEHNQRKLGSLNYLSQISYPLEFENSIFDINDKLISPIERINIKELIVSALNACSQNTISLIKNQYSDLFASLIQ